jgi:putative ABC transport system ATP-binding protein
VKAVALTPGTITRSTLPVRRLWLPKKIMKPALYRLMITNYHCHLSAALYYSNKIHKINHQQKNKMIHIQNLEKIYRTEEVETVALNNLSIDIKEGEFVAIMGPSGCGKSTLLNILGLLDDQDEGSFVFNGIEVAKFNERKRADLRKRNIGFVFQSFNLIDELTVFENVELPLIYTGVKPGDRKKRVEEVLDKMQIMHRRNHYPQQLSGGQQQRVAVARAVVNKPKLILADEPTGNLDSSNGNEVMQLLTDLNEQGTTVVMVTHSEHDARYSHRIIRMLDGQTVTENILV